MVSGGPTARSTASAASREADAEKPSHPSKNFAAHDTSAVAAASRDSARLAAKSVDTRGTSDVNHPPLGAAAAAPAPVSAPSKSAPSASPRGARLSVAGAGVTKTAKDRLCPHGRRANGYYCRECGGKGICEHNRQRSKCRECNSAVVCEHNRIRYRCTECGGASICVHKRMRYQCKDCAGSSICPHKRVRAYCKECKGSQICPHGRVKSHCAACWGLQICLHGMQRGACVTCKETSRRTATVVARVKATTSTGPFSILRNFEG